MKLTDAGIDRALTQLDAQAVPENHPVQGQLSDLFGEHTFFLDAGGLAIIEPAKLDGESASMGQVVKLASWVDESRSNLAPHRPEYTRVVVALDKAA
jgi:hypothetical protein